VHTRVYSALVLLVFLKNLDKKKCTSVKQLIQITDKLAEQLGVHYTATESSKRNIINDMIRYNFLVAGTRKQRIPIGLSQRVRNFLFDILEEIVIDDTEPVIEKEQEILEKSNDKKKYDIVYKEIYLGFRNIIKIGNSLAIIVPSDVVTEEQLYIDDHFYLILLKRNETELQEISVGVVKTRQVGNSMAIFLPINIVRKHKLIATTPVFSILIQDSHEIGIFPKTTDFTLFYHRFHREHGINTD